jgi:DNA-binding NarL/FixJ family response regulator
MPGQQILCHAERVRVLVVDDHAEFRASARALLESDGLDVVGEAADADQAVSEAARLEPDLVIVDIVLPGADGFTTAHRLAALPRRPLVVLVSSRDARSFGDRLPDPTTLGFVSKGDLSAGALARLVP